MQGLKIPFIPIRPNAYHYNVDYLLAKVSDETKTAVKELKIESVDGNNVLNVQADKGICTIKNLSVTYIDQKNYMTKITSDIVLTCPPMDYAQKHRLQICFPMHWLQIRIRVQSVELLPSGAVHILACMVLILTQ